MSTQSEGTVIQRFGSRLAESVERWMPSPFFFAIFLTYIVFIAGVLIEGQSPSAMVQYWYDGFWSLLTFAMQMVLILATGYVLAYHPRVQDIIGRLCEIPSTGAQAAVMVGVTAMVIGWIQWGLGLIVGAVFAREMGRQAHHRDLNVHYPLLCVAGFMGMGLTWHVGLSGSAPLLMNTPQNFFIQQGIVSRLIPTTKTVFHPYTLILVVSGIIYAAIMLYLLSPPESQSKGITEYLSESQLGESSGAATDGGEVTEEPQGDATPSDKLNNSRITGGVIALTGIIYAIYTFATQGLDALDLNIVNFTILFIGFALFTRPAAYQEQFYEAVTSTGGIILQFPFYAGIIGMMSASGLGETIAEVLVSISTPELYPAVVLITSGIVNTFVPSGGGEWTVIGPTILTAAKDLGVPLGQTIVAYAFGSAWADLIQPFWALPLLGITGMRARDIYGYAIMMLLLLFPFLAIGLTIIPY
jgi:short-chain fatty acids transporter